MPFAKQIYLLFFLIPNIIYIYFFISHFQLLAEVFSLNMGRSDGLYITIIDWEPAWIFPENELQRAP